MKTNKKIALSLSKLFSYCKSFIELSIWLLFFAAGIRFFEAILLNYQVKHDLSLSVLWNFSGLCYDIFLFLRNSIWILVLFIVFCFINEKWTKIVFRFLFGLMLLLSLIGVAFFTNSGFLLDKVVFTYTVKEILFIIRSSNETPVWIYFIMVSLPVLYFYLSGKKIKINNVLLIVFFVLTLSSFFIFNNLSLQNAQYHVKVNKTHFFLKSVQSKRISEFKETDEEILKAIKEFRGYFPDYQFAEIEYPFLYKATNKDVLSPFFNLKSKLPNIVFIIIEGLGHEFINPEVMPFLDSLSKKSLTWEHCLSAAARTFGVLPGLFGAAPLGEKGFMEQCPNNPVHHSLLSVLHQNNYTHNLFYGCLWSNFDHIDNFALQNNMSYQKNQEWDKSITEKTIGAMWGYEDHLLYMQALQELNRQTSSPRNDTYLTLSTHGPWEYPRKSFFQNRVKSKVEQNQTLTKKEKTDIINSVEKYGSFAYSDWALQQLIKGYQKREDFDNTIFIITGDHHAFVRQFGGYFNYRVPLIIYSPMLKSGRNMKGVVSHRDITPTLLSLLYHNFNLKTPTEVSWLNSALDTSLSFNAGTFSPLQLTDHTVGGIVYKNYLLCEGILEELTDGVPRKINEPKTLEQMNRLLALYRFLDLYILNNNALIRNPYAYKEPKKVVVCIEDTIASNSYFAKKEKLPVMAGPERRKTTLYFDGSNSYPLVFLKFDIQDNIEVFKVETEFDIYIKNDIQDQNLKVVMDLNDQDKYSLYKADELTFEKQNQWYSYKNSITYRRESWASFEGKPILSVYIWNPNNLEGYIDNIRVKVMADK
jgi:phosphoglycerol transferase MdoB-like AlkP superfamily enzyme